MFQLKIPIVMVLKAKKLNYKLTKQVRLVYSLRTKPSFCHSDFNI